MQKIPYSNKNLVQFGYQIENIPNHLKMKNIATNLPVIY